MEDLVLIKIIIFFILICNIKLLKVIIKLFTADLTSFMDLYSDLIVVKPCLC